MVSNDRVTMSLEQIDESVQAEMRGQLNVIECLKKGDTTIANKTIAVTLYKAFKRRGNSHIESLKSTKQLIDSTIIKVVVS